MTLAHISDVHFGRISHADIVDAMVQNINDHDPRLVVVSGDLTQRARRWQFREASRMIARFEAPVMVIPGNHDVPAWYWPVERVFTPLNRYENYISADSTPSFESDELAVFGMSSAFGMTIKGGWIRESEIEAMSSFFVRQPPGRLKVLTVHHHLVPLEGIGSHDVARNGQLAFETAAAAGVELILCGHLHQSHIETVSVEAEAQPVVIASAGTATSSRGRQDDRLVNYYNFVTAGDDRITIEERRFEIETRIFVTVREQTFQRPVGP